MSDCKGWYRYNNGEMYSCDREAEEGSYYCQTHQEVAATDPLGVK